MPLKRYLSSIPGAKTVARKLNRILLCVGFPGSAKYWDEVYASGGNSGEGSYGRLADFKAEILNQFVTNESIASVIEFGCGDGNQLSLASYPMYMGVDVSPSAISRCKSRFKSDASKRFVAFDEYNCERAQLAVSLDVVYHLVEDSVYESYMKRLFDAATHFVAIYSTNYNGKDIDDKPHVLHRRFSDWVSNHRTDFVLIQNIKNRFPSSDAAENGSPCEFYFYKRL